MKIMEELKKTFFKFYFLNTDLSLTIKGNQKAA